MVRRRIAESRGELRGGPGEPAIASALELDGNRVAAVRLADSTNAHVARAFVIATDAEQLISLLPADVRDGRPAAALRSVRAARQLLSVNLVVKETALPPALGDNVLALRDAAAGDGLDNAVFLQVLPARRDARKGSEKGAPAADTVTDERVVCASGFVAAGEGRAALEGAATRIRESVQEAIPFFDRHLVAESAPVLAAERRELSAAHPLYAGEQDDGLGVTGLPVRGPWKNLVFAGREVIPGLGVEGEFYAGIQAAGHVAALLGRKDVLK
jgi:hypothetical protein